MQEFLQLKTAVVFYDKWVLVSTAKYTGPDILKLHFIYRLLTIHKARFSYHYISVAKCLTVLLDHGASSWMTIYDLSLQFATTLFREIFTIAYWWVAESITGNRWINFSISVINILPSKPLHILLKIIFIFSHSDNYNWFNLIM